MIRAGSAQPATYSDWLNAHRRWGPDSTYVLYALEVLVREGQWTPSAPGSPQLIYVHTTVQADTYLDMLVRSGLAQRVSDGTWSATDAGRALDAGRGTMCPDHPVRYRETA